MNVPETKQILRVEGEVRVITKEGEVGSNGIVSFYNDLDEMAGQMRVLESVPRIMLLDTYRLSSFAVRANEYEGIENVGGENGDYSFYVSPGKCQMKALTVQLGRVRYPGDTGTTNQQGNVLIQANRFGTAAATSNTTFHSLFTQNTFRGENMLLGIGETGTGGIGYLGLYATTGFSSDATRRLFLGLRTGSTFNKAIEMDPSGNVSIPVRLNAGTVSATTYLNLPSVPPSQLLPITLNKTQNRVGINNTTPNVALDVTGHAHITETLDAGNLASRGMLLVVGDTTLSANLEVSNSMTVRGRQATFQNVVTNGETNTNTLLLGGIANSAKDNVLMYDTTTKEVSYGSAPTSDITPITLDKTNNRVGINNTTPNVALDVTGHAHITETLDAGNLASRGQLLVVGDTTLSANLEVKGGAGIDGDLAVLGDAALFNANVLGKVTAGTVEASTWIGLPPANVAPITLDPEAFRVGINKTNPQYSLDVVGNANVSNNIRSSSVSTGSVGVNNVIVRSGATSPEGTVSAETGSLYMDYGGKLWVKASGQDVTGWAQAVTNLIPITLDKVNNRVGINQTTPVVALDVVGEAQTTGTVYCSRLQTNLTPGSVAIGSVAGWGGGTMVKQAAGAVAVGPSAGRDGQQASCTAIGSAAGMDNQGANATAIGRLAGSSNQGSLALALGFGAGQTNQHANTIVLSAGSTALNTDGAYRFYVKPMRPESSVQSAVMNYNSTTGEITYGAPGWSTEAVALGSSAGWGSGVTVKQATGAVALGYLAGSDGQLRYSTAVGRQAGRTTQGQFAVAVGNAAGQTSQGDYAIALGSQAGTTSQHANSIILNATTAALNSDGASRFFVKPIRSLVDATLPRLSYNATTGEICYGDSTTASLLPITLDKVNTRVGINKTVPTTALDVDGEVTASGLLVSGGVNANTLSLRGIPNASTSNALYYNPTTKAVSYGAAGSSSATYTEGFLAADVLKPSGVETVIFTIPFQPGIYQFQANIVSTPDNNEQGFTTYYLRIGTTSTIINSLTSNASSTIATAFTNTLTQTINVTAPMDLLVCFYTQSSGTAYVYANCPAAVASRVTSKTGWTKLKVG